MKVESVVSAAPSKSKIPLMFTRGQVETELELTASHASEDQSAALRARDVRGAAENGDL